MVDVGNIIDAVYRGLEIRFYIGLVYVYDVRDPVSTASLRSQSAYFQFYSTTIFPAFNPHTAVVFSTVEPPDGAYIPNLYSFCHPANLVPIATSGKNTLMVGTNAAAGFEWMSYAPHLPSSCQCPDIMLARCLLV